MYTRVRICDCIWAYVRVFPRTCVCVVCLCVWGGEGWVIGMVCVGLMSFYNVVDIQIFSSDCVQIFSCEILILKVSFINISRLLSQISLMA